MPSTVHVLDIDRTCDTLAVTVTVGRRAVDDAGTPGYATARLEHGHDVLVPMEIRIDHDTGPRHIGRLSDTTVEHPYPDEPRTSVAKLTSVGPLARWGRVIVGDLPWPAETVRARAERIAALVGEHIVVQGGNMLVLPRDVDRQPASKLLTELASSTGGWLFDHAGTVYLQALDARAGTPTVVRWDDEQPLDTWDDLDLVTWADDDAPAPMRPIVLDCSEILWEPNWAQTSGSLATTVIVEYGDPVQRVKQTDTGNIGLVGKIEHVIRTTLAERGDAITLAAATWMRMWRPRWALNEVRLNWADVTEPNRARLLAALPGTRVTVTGLPPEAPETAYSGVLEGWHEEHTYDDSVWTLYLSDLEHSITQPRWVDDTAGATWLDLDPTLTWEGDLT